MEYINVNLPDGTLLSLECNYDSERRICTLSQDVKINGWTVRKEMEVGGPKTSQYKYCFDNFVEFLLTDKKGNKDYIRYFYNLNTPGVVVGACKETMAMNYDGNPVLSAISHFLNKASVFECADWGDYRKHKAVVQIRQIAPQQLSDEELLNKIVEIVHNLDENR